MGYLPSSPGQTTGSSAIFTRRRLKTFFPILIALLLIPFLFSAFHGESNDRRNLLSRTRWLYNKDGDSRSEPQSTLKSPNGDEDSSEEIDSDFSDDYQTGPAIPLDKDEPDFEDLDYGPEDPQLDYENTKSFDNWMKSDSKSKGGSHSGKGVSLLDLMDFPEGDEISTIPDRGDYRELFSLTTRDRRYIPVFIEGAGVHSPSLIPHPTKFDMWIILAQRVQLPALYGTFEQIVCTAGFLEGVLICAEPFENITMSSVASGACEGDLAYVNEYVGARDARLFHSPQAPYIMYGSQSQHTCSGEWLRDARTLLEPFHLEKPLARIFGQPAEVQRPPPWKGLETNYFLFWDSEGKAYAHHEMFPERVFAQLDIDGSVSENLGKYAANKDQVCMAKYMPLVEADDESIQQASNSLAVTLCERLNPKCKPSDSNTFVMHMFHQSFSYDGHTVHEPFLQLFKQAAPFALHAISQRPLWIHGRQALTNETHSPQYEAYPDDIPPGHTERFAITSLSWKNHVQRYHGYSDDVIVLGISIEDGRAGLMDVKVSDILQDLAFC